MARPAPQSNAFAKSFGPPEPATPAFEPAAILRELARNQKLNGSWDDNVERTAGALLAFVRNGHTTLSGHFRKQVARAFSWLAQSTTQGFPAFLRALALHELAGSTQSPEHKSAAVSVLQSLPAPANAIEFAFLSSLRAGMPKNTSQQSVRNMDDLRMAISTGVRNVKIAPELLTDELARIFAAGLD